MKQKIPVLFFMLISAAQAHNFGGLQNDYGYHVSRTSDGFILCGDSAHVAYIVKLDLCGQKQWSRTYSDTFPTHAHCIVESGSGYTMMGAVMGGGVNGGARAWLLRIGLNGDSLWSNHYAPDYWATYGTYVTKYATGYVLGTLGDGQTATNYHNLFLTDTAGNPLDTAVVNLCGLIGGSPSEISPTSDGGFISASSNGLYDPSYFIQVVKVDSLFNITFDKWFGDQMAFYSLNAYGVCEAPGGYVVVGSTDINGTLQMLCMMLDNNGDSLWTKAFGSGELICVKPLPDGYIMAAPSMLVRTNFNGDTLWTKPVNGTIRYIDVTEDGYVLVGDTSITWQQNSDVWLMLTDTYGNEISCTTLGLTYPTEKTIDIFPNPSSGPVTINYMGDIFVYDTKGTLVEKSIDTVTLSLPTGMYFVRTGLKCRKLLIIR